MQELDTFDLLDMLDRHHLPAGNLDTRNKRGERERWIDCPGCKRPTTKSNRHFSYGERGGHCFSCGFNASLWQLCTEARLVEDSDPYLPKPRREARQEAPQAPPEPAWWLAHAERLLARYERHSARYAAWQAHKPLARFTIDEHRLGVGVLPASACKHERLILPVFAGGSIVSLRGRAISCECAKWLSPRGSVAHCYGLERVKPGCILWIVENNPDALLVEQETGYCAVASTNGAGTWSESWTACIAALKPRRVYVALDNDLPGNGGAGQRASMIAAWRAEHPTATRLPVANGPRILSQLLAAGVSATLFKYPPGAPHKASVADLMTSQHRYQGAA